MSKNCSRRDPGNPDLLFLHGTVYMKGDAHGQVLKTMVIPGLYPSSVDDFGVLMDTIDMVSRYSWYDGIEFFYDGTWGEYSKIRRFLEAKGLMSVFLAGYPMKRLKQDIGSFEENERLKAVEAMKHWIDVSASLASKKILILSGPAVESQYEQEACVNTLKSLMEICDYAGRSVHGGDLEITLEFFNDQGEPYLLVGPTAMTSALAESVTSRHANFGITYDLSHILQLGEDVEKSLVGLRDHIRHVHIANCVISDRTHRLYGDKHPPFGIQGSSVSEKEIASFMGIFRRSMEGMKDILLGMEVIAPEGEDPDNLLDNITDTYRRCVKEYL